MMDEIRAANLFIAARGRDGEMRTDDRDVLVQLLREFANAGVLVGLRKSKELFLQSTDARGGCTVLLQGHCDCFLCRVEDELRLAEQSERPGG